jgi:hypothetical protein
MYRFSLLLFVIVTLLVRLCFLEEYPVGFSSHTVVHAKIRVRLYELIYLSPWTDEGWRLISDIVLRDHHGPQSLLEAFLVPLFGFGSSESRLMIGSLGLLSLVFVVLWGTVGVNKWFGLVLGLVVGLAPYGLYFSRYGDSEHINIYWQAFLLLFACQRVINRGCIWDYALMGVAAALSLYVYATNQILCVLTIPFVMFFKLLQWRSDQRSWWPASLCKVALFGSVAGILAYPLLKQYSLIGRFIPARSPLANPDEMGLAVSSLPQKCAAVWRELFVMGGDTWFSREEGSIYDWDLLLLIPGLITMFAFVRSARAHHRAARGAEECRAAMSTTHSTYFFCLVTILIVVFGALPGVLSPEPSFRRIVLTAIGLDIIEALGLYGTICLVFRRIPRIAAQSVAFVLLVVFALGQWNTFFYHSHSIESSSNNSVVALVREMKRKVRAGDETFVLMPGKTSPPQHAEVLMWINYEFGFPKQLPLNLKVLDPEELGASSYAGVLVPIETARKIDSKQIPLPAGVEAIRMRRFSNQTGETYALVDFRVVARGEGVAPNN